MDYGFGVPTRGPLAKPETLATLASRGEELGFKYINVSDHIVIPRDINSRYPYSESGEFTGWDSGECIEQLTLVTFLASRTSRARLLTSVMVLPHRSPVFTAKALASIDVLSGGRLTVGCGVGWLREEFEAVGAPPFDHRGAVGSEYIQAFKELWTSDNPTFRGKYSSFSNIMFSPKPVQKPHPPIWVGGESPPAMRRAAMLGDAWYPIGNNPGFPLQTVDQLADAIQRLYHYAEEYGRDPKSLDVAFSAGWYNEKEAQPLPDGQRLTFTGTPEQIAGDIRAFEALGVHHLMLGFQAPTLEETLERMEYFTREIMPLTDGSA